MASVEEKLSVLQEKLKETDHQLSICIVLLQQYLRQEKCKKQDMKSVGVQVNTEARTLEKSTYTETQVDKMSYHKNLTDIFGIFDKLKTELVVLHTHIEQQGLKL